MDGSLSHCKTLIADGDEDLSLSIGYASPDDAPRLAALFAMQIELRRIPHAVSEAPLGEIRLQWWREALDEAQAGGSVRAHPVVQALAKTRAAAVDYRAHAESMIDARARLLYEPRFSSLEDLSAFLRAAEVPLAALALGSENKGVNDAAAAYALARFAPIHAPEHAKAAADEARRIYASSAPSLRKLEARDAGALAFVSLTRGYAAKGVQPWPLGKRAAMFRAILTGRF